MQIKPSLTKPETFHIAAVLSGNNCIICRLEIPKMWTQDFYLCPAVGNSASATQKLRDFRYRNQTLNKLVKITLIFK